MLYVNSKGADQPAHPQILIHISCDKAHGRIQRGGGGEGGGWGRPSLTHILEKKSQVAFGFLRNTGTDPLEKQFGPIASRGRFIRPFVKYLDD